MQYSWVGPTFTHTNECLFKVHGVHLIQLICYSLDSHDIFKSMSYSTDQDMAEQPVRGLNFALFFYAFCGFSFSFLALTVLRNLFALHTVIAACKTLQKGNRMRCSCWVTVSFVMTFCTFYSDLLWRQRSKKTVKHVSQVMEARSKFDTNEFANIKFRCSWYSRKKDKQSHRCWKMKILRDFWRSKSVQSLCLKDAIDIAAITCNFSMARRTRSQIED